ncbi:hypothetical protein [Herbidospora daliensis]|uniref:hypothetical protein n=1 Tax=Herbidospora daliensis TaxID=295585 RepID=UPI000781F09D|nr:hypothetical protein [Herbidospora daliensis]
MIRRLVRHLPEWVQAQPISVMCVLLGIPSGVLTLVGPSTSRALDTVLPFWARPLWAASLLLGCLAWGAGLASVREVDGRLVVRRLPAMILGLQLISITALVYGVAIITVGGWAGALAAWPLGVVAFGTAVEQAVLSNRRGAYGR